MCHICLTGLCVSCASNNSEQESNKIVFDHKAQKIGEKLSERYLSQPFRNFDGINTPPSEVTYTETCTWLGALQFADATKDKGLLRQLQKRFYPLLGVHKYLMQKPDHVDHTVFGAIPLQLYMQTGDESFYHLGLDFADRQWQMPSGSDRAYYRAFLADGLTWQTRYWIDDMFMITTIQSQAYLASLDRKYIDRAAHQMSSYLDSIQQSNALFYHAAEAPFYWCRGDGWMAVGMADLLKYLPEDNADRTPIMKQYQRMMASLKSYRNAEGLWSQLVDKPDSWTETSGSAMFTYAILVGVNRGWLDADEYAPIAREAWKQLLTYLDENYDIKEVCQGTNIGHTEEYYLARKRVIGDLHGQAPMLWCATELLK